MWGGIFIKISPKIDISHGGLKTLKRYVDNRIEIQLLDFDLKKMKKSILAIIDEIPNIKTICLHLPGCCYNIEDIATNEHQHNRLLSLVDLCNKLQNATNISFRILAHCGWSKYAISDNELILYMKKTIKIFKENNITLLFENTIEVTDTMMNYDRACYIVSKVNHKHLRLCMDMSHIRAMANRFSLKIDTDEGFLKLSEYYRYLTPSKVEQIHFSAALNGDGYMNMRKTHGTKHYDVCHAYNDYLILEQLKIHNAYFVPEVMEIDHNYNKRKCELKEILLLKEIFRT